MIDINTLHIGSTVGIGGKMQRVSAIDALNGQIGIDAYTTDAKGVKRPFGFKIEDVEPIPITEELLTVLGFEYTSHDFGMWWEKKIGKHNCEVDVRNDKWYVLVKGCDFEFNYLHELEAFLYLTTKTELIKE